MVSPESPCPNYDQRQYSNKEQQQKERQHML